MEIDHIIKSRKTQKVFSKEAWQSSINDLELKTLVNELLDLAAHAPYHYPCNNEYISQKELNSSLPYRIYVLNKERCIATSEQISEAEKIQHMLFAADVVFLITWLPEPSNLNSDGMKRKDVNFESNVVNMEHIAAASIAAQHILLGATSRNIPNYWSSGGKLRTDAIKEYLNIPVDEILMGSLFLFPKDIENRNTDIVNGKLRHVGKNINTWSKWV